MKYTIVRKLIALPLAIAAIGASAVELSLDGRGDVLLYPFYSAEGGNDTYVSVANNTDQPKALRVRFREGRANKEVLSFNLYLGPRDHWAGAVTTHQEGARLISNDDSCTYPEQPDGGFVFSNSSYEGDEYSFNGLERTREGTVEIIEMGILDDDSDNGAFDAIQGIFGSGIGEGKLDTVYFTVTPIISGCDVVNKAWQPDRAFARNPSLNISPATGGLSGYGVVINVSEGTNITYNATALKNFFDGGFLHSHPDEASPSLADAAPVARIYHENHGLIEIETERGVDAVSSVLIRSEIGSDLVMESSINASTAWVITFPLLQYDAFLGPPYSIGDYRMKFYDRQGESSSFSYYAVDTAGNAVTILEFGNSEGIFHASSRIARTMSATKEIINGHAILDLRTYIDFMKAEDNKTSFNTNNGTVTLTGAPVIGFAVQKYVNGNVNGVLSNYTGTLNYHSALEVEVQED